MVSLILLVSIHKGKLGMGGESGHLDLQKCQSPLLSHMLHSSGASLRKKHNLLWPVCLVGAVPMEFPD